MNYGNIKECDIADGPGVRVSLFVSGCRHHCIPRYYCSGWRRSASNARAVQGDRPQIQYGLWRGTCAAEDYAAGE